MNQNKHANFPHIKVILPNDITASHKNNCTQYQELCCINFAMKGKKYL